ncbi:Hypothetical protein ACI5QL_02710 [Bacillus velezensis]
MQAMPTDAISIRAAQNPFLMIPYYLSFINNLIFHHGHFQTE